MKSEIDDKLTDGEKAVLQRYRSSGNSSIRRAFRLSIQYALGAGIFVWLAIEQNEPLYVLVVYAVFVLWMIIRLLASRRLAGVMPQIIEKYESEIARIRSSVKPKED